MLLTFLYHRVHEGKYSNSLAMIKENLRFLAETKNIVIPGDKLPFFTTNICLTFDDAYFDFYHYVFPLLKELNIKAVLAVPIKFILEKTTLPPNERLNISYSIAMKGNTYQEKAPFCTWEEIQEMVDSGHVCIASHSYNHKNLLEPNVDLHFEIVESKKILEKKLGIKISTFVYPLGKFNHRIHQYTKKYYKYAMRIGSAWNFSWQNCSKITYRIISDSLKIKEEHLKPKRYLSYIWFFLLNTIRKR